MYYIYVPTEMRQQMALDDSVIQMFQHGYKSETSQVSGIWQTYQGELYVRA